MRDVLPMPPTVDVATTTRSFGAITLAAGNRTLTFDGSGRLLSGECEPSIAPGTVLNGRYRIDALVGEGGMGRVYRAYDRLRDERAVALKMVRASGLSAASVAFLKAEFRTMTQLRHPNVAQVYDFEPLAGAADHLFTMEIVDGTDALEATRGARWQAIVGLLVQVCRALSYVHSRRIAHFDLKPANVLLTRDGIVKVVDFGLAGADPSGFSQRLIGSPHYMAPELFLRTGHADHRADLYSLGITAYQLLYGSVPFRRASLSELIAAHHEEPLPFDDAPSVPAWLREIVVRLCAKQASDRFRSGNDVIAAINRGGALAYELETHETRESYILSSRFVGRDADLERLLGFALRRLSRRHEPAVAAFVAGPSGIGKSRLMRELRQRLQLQRVLFVEGNCYEHGASALAPLAAPLHHLVRLAQAAGQIELLERVGPQLKKLDPSLPLGMRPAPAHPDAARERALVDDAVCELMIELALAQPYAFYLNDAQWADAAVVTILERLADKLRTSDARLALLVSYRSDEVDGRPIASLVRDSASAEIVGLEPLAASDIREIVRSMLGIEDLPSEFVERLASRTGGNPFFVEEVMRALVEQGHVYLDEMRWAASSAIERMPFPASVFDALRRRASLLSDSQRLVLELCAAHGQALAASVIQRATELDGDAVHETLAILRDRSMLRQEPGAELAYRTAHDRIRETTYGDLAPADRRARHESLARALAQQYGAGGAVLLAIGEHWLDALAIGEPPPDRSHVADVLVRAADCARVTGSFALGLRLLRAALSLLGDMPHDAVRANAERLLLELLFFLGDVNAAEAQHAALVAADRLTMDQRVEIDAIRMQAYMRFGRYRDAYLALRAGAAALGHDMPEHPGYRHLVWPMVRIRLHLSKLTPARLKPEEPPDPRVAALARLINEGGIACNALGNASWAGLLSPVARLLAHDRVHEASLFLSLAGATEILEKPRELATFIAAQCERDAHHDKVVTGITGMVSFVAEPIAACRARLEQASSFLYESGELVWANYAANVMLTQAAGSMPTLRELVARIEKYANLLRLVGSAHTLAEIRSLVFLLRALAGPEYPPLPFEELDMAKLLPGIEHDYVALSHTHVTKAWVALLFGDANTALREAEVGILLARRGVMRQYWSREAQLIVVAAGTRGGSLSKRAQRKELERLASFAELCPTNFVHLHRLAEAEVLRARGDLDRAAARAREGIAAAHDNGFPWLAAFGAELLADIAQRAGDRASATTHRDDARDRYAAWGAHAKARALGGAQ